MDTRTRTIKTENILFRCFDSLPTTNKTKLSCLVRVGGVNTIGDKTKQFCLISTQFRRVMKLVTSFNTYSKLFGHGQQIVYDCRSKPLPQPIAVAIVTSVGCSDNRTVYSVSYSGYADFRKIQ